MWLQPQQLRVACGPDYASVRSQEKAVHRQRCTHERLRQQLAAPSVPPPEQPPPTDTRRQAPCGEAAETGTALRSAA